MNKMKTTQMRLS